MELIDQQYAKDGLGQKFLRWINLRPEESERTLLMFAFYTTTAIGLMWLEASAVGLFLEQYGAANLPIIYIASSGISVGLGFLYSWLQKYLSLRRVIVLIALLMALPLLLLQFGLSFPAGVAIGGIAILKTTVLLLRLWLEAIYVLNDLNASIAANQLFNIREIKRTFPLISSGVLVADIVSGFSLPFILAALPRDRGIPIVILLSFGMMMIGAGILSYLCHTYQQAFPASRRRRDDRPVENRQEVRGKMQRYVWLLVVFFVMAQVLLLLVDFQFLSQLEKQPEFSAQSEKIASFLSVFNGALGICELIAQWLFSSRVIETVGVFQTVMALPVVIVVMTAGVVVCEFVTTAPLPIFLGLVMRKFLYELLHYTLFASVSPVLFQPVPEAARGRLQATIRGIAEPIATGATGIVLFWLVWLTQQGETNRQWQNLIFGVMILLAVGWWVAIYLLKQDYVKLLVFSAGRGQLSGSDVDLRELKRAVIEALEKPGVEADKRSCIELLSQIDPKNVGEVLAPLLDKLTSGLQQKSLEVMLNYPSVSHLRSVKDLVTQKPAPEVMAVALRYIWLTDENSDIRQLRSYLHPEVDPIIRGTAASLMLKQGTPTQKAEATNALRLMLTHKHKQERVMGCRALGEAVYLQALRLYIPNLLQDKSLPVRCAVLEAIGATRLEEYYPSLLRGLSYKSTRNAAQSALVKLENDALKILVKLAEDVHQPNLVRCHAWSAIGQIGTTEAIEILIAHLKTSWGETRRNILRILLKIPQEKGIESVLDRLGRRGVEQLIDQEIMFIGQIYAALVDLTPERARGQEADLLRRSLRDLPSDGIDRLFLLMKFLYSLNSIQVASFNLQSGSKSNMAQGLEILDNTLDIPSKRALLAILDSNRDVDKLQSLAAIVGYEPMNPHDRLRYLLDLRHFLSDWSLACCFHLARQSRWSLTSEQILACLNHPQGFVREAVLSYLQLASPSALTRILPMLENDPDRLVASQVKEMMAGLNLGQIRRFQDDDLPNTGELEPL
ncbi:HEAT repeat domain-containing protein [Phormidesmis priestleyi]